MTSPIDRRKFLKTAGATAAAGLVVAGTGEAASAAAPAAQPGIITISPIIPIFILDSIKYIGMFDWSYIGAGTITAWSTPPTGISTNAFALVAPVGLEKGDVLDSVSVYASGAGSLTVEIWGQDLDNPGTWLTGAALATHTLTISGTVKVVNVAMPDTYATIADNHQLQVWVKGTSGPALIISEAKVFYQPAHQGFFPIAPARVYDSRLTGGGGPLASGATRNVSVANQIDVTTGAVVTNNIVPDGAYAISYNLTAASPSAPGGFLAIYAKGGTLKASALNFTAGEDVANGGVVTVSSDRMVTVQAGGGGSTDFVIDITGYYI